MLEELEKPLSFVYGPVKSWRSGASLGIDPIGKISSCSFNCSYCQLGQIQNISSEIKIYVRTEEILKDLKELYSRNSFNWNELDVITFAGSGEPTLAENLGEIIQKLRSFINDQGLEIPISILSNATLLENKEVRKRVLLADEISLKLDASNEKILKSLNQPAKGINLENIIKGIKNLKMESSEKNKLQLQIMFMPNFLKQSDYLEELSKKIIETGISKIQINTPSRPVPKFKEYRIETRGNHYVSSSKSLELVGEYSYLPVISPQEAWDLEEKLRLLLCKVENLEIINVHPRN